MNDGKPTLVKLVLDNGSSPIDEWFGALRDATTRARIARSLDKLGRGVPGPHRSVGQGVNELTLDFGPGYRVYYAEWRQVVVVLLGGGDKGSQQRDIELARQRWSALKNSDISVEDLATPGTRRQSGGQKGKGTMRLVAFDETLYRELQDDAFAMAYLQDALDESLEEFMIALGKCIRARGGMTRCAKETGLSREALYRMFQPGANPTMQSIERILRAAGLRLYLRADRPGCSSARNSMAG